jgi:cell division protein FtsI (penicillin-binding protein 3)
LGCAVIARAVYIQVKEGPALRAMAREMHTRFETLEAERGNIVDEEGTPLSTSIPEFDIHIDFSVIDTALFAEQIDSLSRCMASLFVNKGKSAEDYKEEFVRAYDEGVRYYPLGKKLKYYEYEALRSFPIFIKGKNGGGFIAEPKEKRRLPYGELARRTLGIFRDSNINGLEAMYDKELAGENGRRVVQKSTGGLWVPVDGSEADPVNGRDIVTTLDMDVQAVAHDALLSNLRKYECQYGTCIVMEVATGKIRTLVNLGHKDGDSVYQEIFNYATIPTEPGSTFKLVTLTALLSEKYINVDNTVDIQGGRRQFANRVMEDSHPNAALREMPIWKAYAISSNVGMAKLADQYFHDHPEKYVGHLRRLGLDKPTGIDLMGERKSKVMGPESKMWSKTSLPWMAIGYGVQITPLHTCMLYNAVANEGKIMKPYLVSAIKEYGKVVKDVTPTVLGTLGDEEVVRQLRKCTRAVVTEGTGKDIASPYYTMSGKTGTAQVADKGIRYTDGVYQGSYVGYMPAENPRYTICVVIRTKAHSSAYYGGTIAAPVFRMVADKIFSRNMGAWSTPLDSMAKTSTGVLPARAATASAYEILLGSLQRRMPLPVEKKTAMVQALTDTAKHTTMAVHHVYKGIMPNVSGMTLKDAVFLLENYGVRVHIDGRGKVTGQSVPAGARLAKGQTVTLQLG